MPWEITGNNGTSGALHFLGTMDAQAFSIRVNSKRALRIEPATTANLIGGYEGNEVVAGVIGAAIGGGGADGSLNRIEASFGTVGGGLGNLVSGEQAIVGGGVNNRATGLGATLGGGQGNLVAGESATVGGGAQNRAREMVATIGGGLDNEATGERSTIGGGAANFASALAGTIGGGQNNQASGENATVGGGGENTASGMSSTISGGIANDAAGTAATVAGGAGNRAMGEYSFAAGHNANATHDGTFVWSDAQNNDFASTADNQFLIAAGGGVGIATPSPLEPLDVNGRIKAGTLTVGPWPANEVYAFVGVNTLDQALGINYALLQGTVGGHLGFTFLNSPVGIQFRIKNADKMQLDANGNFVVFTNAFKPGGGAWANSSDRRLKQNVRPLEGALDKVLQLRGVSFEWKEPEKQGNLNGPQMGMIAQEVEEVFPEWISTDSKGYKVLSVRGFEALAVEAFRALKAENEQIRAQNQALASRVAELEAHLMPINQAA